MAIQLRIETRNPRLDTIESTNGSSCKFQIRTGAQPADCTVANSGTLLSSFNLPADWMAAAASGVKGKAGTWQDTSAAAAGTAAHFRMFNSQATMDGTTCFLQGSISATAGGGDLELDNTSIAVGQQVTITQFDLTDGNA